MKWSEVRIFSPRPILLASFNKSAAVISLNILVTNDDGIHSEGLIALEEAMSKLGTVYVVAPDRERSAAGHSLTLHHPLRLEEISLNRYSLDGTPTDCVNLAVNGLLDVRPDIVVSGINKGANLGDDITYSGTVAAAMEGTLLNIPSIAVSLDSRSDFNFDAAADSAAKIVKIVMLNGMPVDTLININVPNLPGNELKGWKVTRQGKRIYGDAVIEKTDPRGRKYFWIGGDNLGFEHRDDSDFEAISKGFISITPLHLDLTNHRAVDELKGWKL